MDLAEQDIFLPQRQPELLLGDLLLGDVAQHLRYAKHVPLMVGDGRRRDCSLELGAVLADVTQLVMGERLALAHATVKLLEQLGLTRRYEDRRRPADHLLGRVAEDS